MLTLARPFLCCLVFLAACDPGPAPKKYVPKPDAAQTRTAPAAEKRLGINLSSVLDWSSEWPFVDAYRTSRPWMESGPGPFTYDDRGNPLLRPLQSVGTLVFRNVDGKFPKGKYVITYQGDGDIDVKHPDVVEVLSKEPGRIVISVYPEDQGIMMNLLTSSPRDPVRDVRVYLPGFDEKSPRFHPLFMQRLEPFSVVRFMDWQRTNASPVTTWSQRSKPEDARWSTDAGVPIEIMCELANTARIYPWFCMPHGADDDYVRRFAKLVKERLDPQLRVYVEYSNEVWNWGFAQTAYAAERGQQARLGAPDHLRYYAKRSTEIFDIFSSEFEPERLVRVLSGQFVNTYDCEEILKFNNAHRKADALAVGAYFGNEFGELKTVEATIALTPDALLDKLEKEIDGKHREAIKRQAQLANKYGLRLLAYEGGQHLTGFGGAEHNAKLTELFMAANRSPRMGELYQKQLQHWYAEGGDLFTAFASCGLPGKFGSWGILEYQDQPEANAPKYRAIKDFARQLGERPK